MIKITASLTELVGNLRFWKRGTHFNQKSGSTRPPSVQSISPTEYRVPHPSNAAPV